MASNSFSKALIWSYNSVFLPSYSLYKSFYLCNSSIYCEFWAWASANPPSILAISPSKLETVASLPIHFSLKLAINCLRESKSARPLSSWDLRPFLSRFKSLFLAWWLPPVPWAWTNWSSRLAHSVRSLDYSFCRVPSWSSSLFNSSVNLSPSPSRTMGSMRWKFWSFSVKRMISGLKIVEFHRLD